MFRAPGDCLPPPVKPARERYVAAAASGGRGATKRGACGTLCCCALVFVLLLLLLAAVLVAIVAIGGVCATPGRCDSSGAAAWLAGLRTAAGGCVACAGRGT
jgi:hypothetical protein